MTDKKQPQPATAAEPPDDFLAKMQRLLGDEYAQFARSYVEERATGLRVNTLKISAADFRHQSPFTLTPVGAYEPAGFLVTADEQQPGRHPYHAAGLYYLQEPAAMVVASLMAPAPGEWVLDLAAAPGGKATHLACLMADEGLLVANDVHAGRARILAENLERWGVRQTLITNDAPDRLAATFGPVFDKVLLDAPCSGEGMFRRQGAFAWSQTMVAACARRQTAILDAVDNLVRPGGLLAYATCTFSPEENEAVVARFLSEHPDYELEDPARLEGFARGRPSWVPPHLLPKEQRQRLRRTVRLWPHRFTGEGHFLALLRRGGPTAVAPHHSQNLVPFATSLPHQARAQWQAFSRRYLHLSLPEKRLHLANGRLYLLPPYAPDTSGIKIVRYGLLLGQVRRGYFKPAHTLAMSLSPAEVKSVVNWTADDPQVDAYLRGHELPGSGSDGWTLVTVDGHSLGWGKTVNGRLKNHYPRGLRR